MSLFLLVPGWFPGTLTAGPGSRVERPAGRTTLRQVPLPATLGPGWELDMRLWWRPSCSLGVRAGAGLRSSLRGSRGWLAAGAWGVSRAGSGINQRRGRAARGRGPDLQAITRCPCPGLLTPRPRRRCG